MIGARPIIPYYGKPANYFSRRFFAGYFKSAYSTNGLSERSSALLMLIVIAAGAANATGAAGAAPMGESPYSYTLVGGVLV